jgi:hypothetical protein
MKRIIILAITAICCGLTIYCFFQYRTEELLKKEIKDVMLARLQKLSEQADSVCVAEFTPFIWDEEYVYGGYSWPEMFNKVMGNKKAEYIETLEYDHREIYYNNEDLIFDTGIVDYYNYWRLYLNDTQYPNDWLSLNGKSDDTSLISIAFEEQ